jgi:hypothetical protein
MLHTEILGWAVKWNIDKGERNNFVELDEEEQLQERSEGAQ